MRQTQNRLRALEQVAAPQIRGHLIFSQSDDDPNLFIDKDRKTFTPADIDILGAEGWVCIICTYRDAPALRVDKEIQLSWGEDDVRPSLYNL